MRYYCTFLIGQKGGNDSSDGTTLLLPHRRPFPPPELLFILQRHLQVVFFFARHSPTENLHWAEQIKAKVLITATRLSHRVNTPTEV